MALLKNYIGVQARGAVGSKETRKPLTAAGVRGEYMTYKTCRIRRVWYDDSPKDVQTEAVQHGQGTRPRFAQIIFWRGPLGVRTLSTRT